MYSRFRQNNILTRGFTLVEMMVAVAVFSIVMVVATSALLNVIDANHKAQSIKTAINNVNFALEGLSKDMRMGINYDCGDTVSEASTLGTCTSGKTVIGYNSPRAYENTDGTHKRAYYKYNSTTQQIEECLEKQSAINCDDNSFSPITSNDVRITNMKFYVLNDNPSTAGFKEQPRMIMTLTGEAGTKDKTKTTFDLQTSISQRVRVNN